MRVETLNWLAGSWIADRNGDVVEETWLPPTGENLLGVSRTTCEGQAGFEEYIRIGSWEGKLALTLIHKLGDPAESYEALEMDGRHALFGNPDDAKKIRIEYSKTDTGVFATVSGLRKGRPFKLEFDFRPAVRSGSADSYVASDGSGNTSM